MDLELPEEDLGPFRLEEDAARGSPDDLRGAGDVTVEVRRHTVAIDDDLGPIPDADGTIEIAWPAKPGDIAPVWVTAPPVESPLRAGGKRATGLIVDLAVGTNSGLGHDPEGRSDSAWDQDQIAASALDQLTFERVHPACESISLWAVGVDQDPRVPRLPFPGRTGRASPPPLGDQMIVGE